MYRCLFIDFIKVIDQITDNSDLGTPVGCIISLFYINTILSYIMGRIENITTFHLGKFYLYISSDRFPLLYLYNPLYFPFIYFLIIAFFSSTFWFQLFKLYYLFFILFLIFFHVWNIVNNPIIMLTGKSLTPKSYLFDFEIFTFFEDFWMIIQLFLSIFLNFCLHFLNYFIDIGFV